MGTQFWVIQAFNGISYGALLFLVGSGLSLIFGVMRIVNLSHGAYFLWGGYIALSVIAATAVEHGLILVTRNVKDFAGLGVVLLNPWDAV